MLDGVYRRTEGEPVFQQARAPGRDELQGLLDKIIARLLKLLTRQGYLAEEQGMTYLADIEPDNPLTPLQAASCTYRIALGPRAGHKVLSLLKRVFALDLEHCPQCGGEFRIIAAIEEPALAYRGQRASKSAPTGRR